MSPTKKRFPTLVHNISNILFKLYSIGYDITVVTISNIELDQTTLNQMFEHLRYDRSYIPSIRTV